jgi:hypothetical protein
VDNGAYEGEMCDFEYLQGWRSRGAVVVAPDFLRRPVESDYVGRQFARAHPGSVMQVVHYGRDDMMAFAGALMNAWGDWIGLPKWNTARVDMLEDMIKSGLRPKQPIHLLGRNSNEEMQRATKLDCIVSMDSSYPWDGDGGGHSANSVKYRTESLRKICRE